MTLDVEEALSTLAHYKQGLPAETSEETLECLYAMGYNLYTNGRYSPAKDTFQLLVALNPENAKYWMGFAATQQLMKEYREAASAYAMVGLLNRHDPAPHLHAAECFFAIEEWTLGYEALDTAEKLSKGDLKYQHYLSKIALLRVQHKE